MLNTKLLKRGKEWLLNSGIQDASGGFYSWYDLNDKNYGYLYSEITGYGISSLMFLHSMEKDNVLIGRARQAAAWLIREARDSSGGFKTRKYLSGGADRAYSFEGASIYAFDCGMILTGLMNVWAATNDALYLEAAKHLGDFLINKMQKPDGEFFAYYISTQNRVFDEPHKWSTQSGSYHAKLSIGLIKLGMATGNKVYTESAQKACLKAMSSFKDGRFVTNRENQSTHLHPHCYTAEGLLYAGYKLNNKQFLDYAARSVEWAITRQEADGGIPFLFHPDGKAAKFQRSDILAQVLRLGLLMREMGFIDKKAAAKLENLSGRLYEFQAKNKEAHNGGFLFGYDFDGKKVEHINAWCSMFAIQALIFYENANLATKESVINFLI